MTNALKMLIPYVVFTLGAVLSIASLFSENNKFREGLHRIGNALMLFAIFLCIYPTVAS